MNPVTSLSLKERKGKVTTHSGQQEFWEGGTTGLYREAAKVEGSDASADCQSGNSKA